MSSRERVRFGAETWAKGDRGLLNAHATDKPSLTNLRLYADGSLGPRPRWRPLPTAVDSKYTGTAQIVPATYRNGVVSQRGYLVISSIDADFLDEDGDVYATGTFSGTTPFQNNWAAHQLTDSLWLIGPYLVNLYSASFSGSPTFTVADTTAAVRTEFGSGNNGPNNAIVHGGRTFWWGGINQTTSGDYYNRVFYSDSSVTGGPGAYGTFTEGVGSQFFDVEGRVAGCVSVGANLFIWTEDGEWTMMQGVGEPRTLTFTALGKAKIPSQFTIPNRVDRAAVFLSSDLNSIVMMGSGGDINDTDLAYLGLQASTYPYSEPAPPRPAVSSLYNSTLIPAPAAGGGLARHNHNSTWTYEDWDLTTYGNFRVGIREREAQEMLAIYEPGMTTQWHIYVRDIAIDAPEFSDAGDFSEFAEDPEGRVVLPRLFDPNRQVRVNRVTMDFRTYSTTGTYYPAPVFNVKVTDGTGASTTLTIEANEDPHGARVGSHRIVASGLEKYTSFSDVEVANIKGIVIEAITVDFEISEGVVF